MVMDVVAQDGTGAGHGACTSTFTPPDAHLLRGIKNKVIGSIKEKAHCVKEGIIERLLPLITARQAGGDGIVSTDDASPGGAGTMLRMKADACIILASLGLGDLWILQRLVETCTRAALLSLINASADAGATDVLGAALRALKTITVGMSDHDVEVVCEPQEIEILLRLLPECTSVMQQHIVSVLSRHFPLSGAAANGAVDTSVCVTLLASTLCKEHSCVPSGSFVSRVSPLSVTIMEALGRLVEDNHPVAQQVHDAQAGAVLNVMFDMFGDPTPASRIVSCETLVNVWRAYKEGGFDEDTDTFWHRMRDRVVPVLILLTSNKDPKTKIRGLRTLSTMARGHVEVQRIACEADVFHKINEHFFGALVTRTAATTGTGDAGEDDVVVANDYELEMEMDESGGDIEMFMGGREVAAPFLSRGEQRVQYELQETALKAVYVLCDLREENREKACEERLLRHVAASLVDPDPHMRVCACDALQALSRSIKNLRTSLEELDLIGPLVAFLKQDEPKLLVSASKAIANFVFSFSPFKQQAVDSGCIELLGQLAFHESVDVRLSSLWALKNIVYKASFNYRQAVIKAVTLERIREILEKDTIEVKRQAIMILQNLCHMTEGVGMVMSYFGNFILDTAAGFIDTESPTFEVCATQALNLLINIALSGNEDHKNMIAQHSSILDRLFDCMGHTKAQVRAHALWCCNNLLWFPIDSDDPRPRASSLEDARPRMPEPRVETLSVRIDALEEKGFPSVLHNLEVDAVVAVRDKAMNARVTYEKACKFCGTA